MEHPKQMISTVTQTDAHLRISTPKKKSWILIIFLFLLVVEFSNGIIQVVCLTDDIPTGIRMAILLVSLTALYFILKIILWQLKGRKEIIITDSELRFIKRSPLLSTSKTYATEHIQSVNIKDETVSEGSLAMLQLLGIKDKIKITFTYGYDTITITSGIDLTEAIELKSRIKKKLKLH
jgi:hypothetical protein